MTLRGALRSLTESAETRFVNEYRDAVVAHEIDTFILEMGEGRYGVDELGRRASAAHDRAFAMTTLRRRRRPRRWKPSRGTEALCISLWLEMTRSPETYNAMLRSAGLDR